MQDLLKTRLMQCLLFLSLSLFSLHLDFDHQNPLSTGYQLLDRTPTLGYARTASENDRIYAYRYNNE